MTAEHDLSISVVVPCFNQGRFLAQALDSVLEQGVREVEIVVVDDGSTDETGQVIDRYGDRIRCLRQRNRGQSAARNAALGFAGGDLVIFLDADDRLLPGALEAHRRAHEAAPGVTVSCGGWQLVDEAGSELRTEPPPAFPDDGYLFLLGGNRMPPCAVAARRSAIVAAGGFDESLRAFEDWALWLEIARDGGRFVPVPRTVGAYRRHHGTMSRNVEEKLRAAPIVLRRHRGVTGRRLRAALARGRAARAVRYGAFCNELWPEARRLWRSGRRAGAGRHLLGAIFRHPSLFESGLEYGLFRLFPGLRRRLGVSPPEDVPSEPPPHRSRYPSGPRRGSA